jgi:hypothetical protein
MGRSDIANYGKRFSTEYQPAGRGRPKGSLNRQTIVRAYFAATEPRTPELVIEAILVEIFGPREARKYRRRRARWA